MYLFDLLCFKNFFTLIKSFVIVYFILCHMEFNFSPRYSNGCFVSATDDNRLLSYHALYTNGVNSYLENDWTMCISYLENALNDWHWWNKNVVRCRELCHDEANSANIIFPDSLDYELDRAFEKLVLNTLCLVQCKKRTFGPRFDVNPPQNVIDDFQKKKPYDYLQLCYYKNGQLDKAANAAATLLTGQPHHQTMNLNLEHYMKMGGFEGDDIIDLEIKEYAEEFLEGDRLYREENYVEAIVHLEKSLDLFEQSLRECRFACEDPFDMGWFPDFVSSIANHYTFTLRCKMKCLLKLSILYVDDDFVASILNYLQFSYYKVANYSKASEAVESILVINPDDLDQIENKAFFKNEAHVPEEFFIPRKSVVLYAERKSAEGKLVQFIDDRFTAIAKTPPEEMPPTAPSNTESMTLAAGPSETPAEDPSEALAEDPLETMAEDPLETSAEDSSETMAEDTSETPAEDPSKIPAGDPPENPLDVFAGRRIAVIADQEALKGSKRVLASGFLNEEECAAMRNLTLRASVEGDGYLNGMNPHTSSESFQGATLSRASMAVVAGLFPPSLLQKISDVTEFSKYFLQQYFSLEKELYFSFTHLVCRTSLTDPSNRNISDLSHVLHADNCILQTNGQCSKKPPAYTFRDYSAILYLNSDFVGGEFIFSRDPTGISYESIISPKCGHLVGFSAGEENLHGVRPVRRGTRCALAMWFTFNKTHQERDRSLIHYLLAQIAKSEIIPGSL